MPLVSIQRRMEGFPGTPGSKMHAAGECNCSEMQSCVSQGHFEGTSLLESSHLTFMYNCRKCREILEILVCLAYTFIDWKSVSKKVN